jgi:hypothetical protein
MPFCPNCQKEYGPEENACVECGTDLVDALEPEQTAVGPEELELVELATFPNVAEAEMIQELLEKNEVRTVLRGEVDPIGVASGAQPTALLVEERDLARAQEIYDAFFAGDGVEPESPEKE